MKPIAAIAGILLALCTATGTRAQEVDTIYIANIPEVLITEHWGNDTARYRYNQTMLYVKSVLPYVNAASKMFGEINAKMNEPGVSRAEKRRYIHSREEELRNQFEKKVKQLNKTQGALLMKLIARQTGANIYQILDEFKNPMTALKWQGWARMNGINLNRKYTPQSEPMLEHIMERLGYPLPAAYAPIAGKR